MTPTNELRFVERETYVVNGEPFAMPRTIRILQQQWVGQKIVDEQTMSVVTEWRDVPCVKEEA